MAESKTVSRYRNHKNEFCIRMKQKAFHVVLWFRNVFNYKTRTSIPPAITLEVFASMSNNEKENCDVSTFEVYYERGIPIKK